jgi:hypothetical protein
MVRETPIGFEPEDFTEEDWPSLFTEGLRLGPV